MTETVALSPRDAVQALGQSLDRLSAKDRDFAASLAAQFERKGRLSERQWPWVQTLLDRAINGYPEPAQEQVGDFAGVVHLLEHAGENLRFPKVRLRTPGGQPVALSVAGQRSRNPGTINVTDGRPFGENRWFGRIERDGTWTKPRSLRDAEAAEIGALLRRMADAPAETAAEYGKLTGHCCFCRHGLEDERSLEVGYGPVCARNYGLPWGSRSGRDTAEHQHDVDQLTADVMDAVDEAVATGQVPARIRQRPVDAERIQDAREDFMDPDCQ